jgi:hypothetical protein
VWYVTVSPPVTRLSLHILCVLESMNIGESPQFTSFWMTISSSALLFCFLCLPRPGFLASVFLWTFPSSLFHAAAFACDKLVEANASIIVRDRFPLQARHQELNSPTEANFQGAVNVSQEARQIRTCSRQIIELLLVRSDLLCVLHKRQTTTATSFISRSKQRADLTTAAVPFLRPVPRWRRLREVRKASA